MNAQDVTVAVAIALAIVLVAIGLMVIRRLRYPSWRRGIRDALSYLGLTCLVAIALVSFFGFAAILVPVGLLGWILLFVVVVEAWRRHRATRQYGLLWLLTVSAERSMPLVPAVEAFASESGGIFGRRTRWAADLMRSGVPLPDVLERVPGLLPAYAVPMIHAGCETGALAPALRQAATKYDVYGPTWMSLSGKLAYLLFLFPPFGLGLFIFIMLKIVPSFQKIFADFGMSLPPATLALISTSVFIQNYWFVILPLYLLAFWLVVHVTMRYFGWVQWDPPGIAGFARRIDTAQILDTLALVAAQGRPLSDGITALARAYPKADIRRRLRQAGLDIEAGTNWCESLKRHGLLRRPEMAVLQAAERVGNVPWALGEMADSVRRRLIYRLQAIAQVAFPPLVILMALMVMFIVLALFLPLLSLIQNLA